MQSAKASRTALAAAYHRAAHQILEQGRIFSDPLAVRIVGEQGKAAALERAHEPGARGMRLFIAARTRFAEDALATAVQRGTRQLVVLGAGLDTFAYRSGFGDRLRIFEADHPATQRWKREMLHHAGIRIPETLTYAPIDFEIEKLPEGLERAGFDHTESTFFTWLGVVPYLTAQAIRSTLAYIAQTAKGAEVVFDYSDPPECLSPEMRERHQRRAERVASIGEAWISYFEADALRSELKEMGFREVEDLGPRDIANRYFPTPAVLLPERGGHIIRASSM